MLLLEIEFLPLVILLLGLIYLRYRTGVGMFGVFAGMIALFMVSEFAAINGLFTLVMAGLALFLIGTALWGAKV